MARSEKGFGIRGDGVDGADNAHRGQWPLWLLVSWLVALVMIIDMVMGCGIIDKKRTRKEQKLQTSFRLHTKHGEPQWQCLFLSEICSKFVRIADATLAISEERESGSS